jgi:hypothetical protein
LELARIKEYDLWMRIRVLSEKADERYLHQDYAAAKALLLELARTYEQLHRAITQSEELRGIIANVGQAPKSQGFDYSRYSVFDN